MTGWKLKLTGVLTVVVAVAGAAKLLLDGDPTTNPDFTSLIAAVTSGVGLLFARQNDVTSEAAGAK